MPKSHIIPFDDCTVVVNDMEDGRWKAYVSSGDHADLDVAGYGDTQLSAIADLNRAIAAEE
jgi:hypothetical protein